MKKYYKPSITTENLLKISDIILTSSTIGGDESNAGYIEEPFPGIYD